MYMLGWEKDLRLGDEEDIGGEDWKDSIMSRWHELPFSKRMQVTVAYAYAWADAMILARKAGAK